MQITQRYIDFVKKFSHIDSIQGRQFYFDFKLFEIEYYVSAIPPCFGIFSGRQTDDLPKTTDKVRIIFKSNDLASLLHTDAAAQQCTGLTNAIVGKVVSHTESGKIFKLMT